MRPRGSLALLWLLAACGAGAGGPGTGASDDSLRSRFALRALGEAPRPPDAPGSAQRVELGRLLFFDPILGGEKDVACGTCHHPSLAFADGRQFGAGAGGSGLGPDRLVSASALTGRPIGLEARNSPTVLNAAYNADESGRPSQLGLQFWDGRAAGLEEQARGPIASRTEMAGDAYSEEVARDSVVARLRGIPDYVSRFRQGFPEEAWQFEGANIISMDTYGRAIAAYERELVTRNSAFDRYARGADDALSERQKRGLELFFTRANCATCHSGPMLSDFRFRVLGVPQLGAGTPILPCDDVGREEHSRRPVDRYAFRTPSLRNVELTAPYMHDGAFATLEEVVSFYNLGARPRHPGVPDSLLDQDVRAPLSLSDEDVLALVDFLKALTDRGDRLPPRLLTVPGSVPSGLTPVFGLKAP
jgi:cytochrome c peroxidase